MRLRDAVALTLVAAALAAATGCQRSIFRQYEYEEEVYLKLDGSASVHINTSIAALIALRGLDLDPSLSARPDREKIRAAYDAPEARVVRVSPPWRRNGRPYVQIRLDVPDVRRLARARPFDWSTYQFTHDSGQYHYRQIWGPSVNKPVPGIAWDGSEIVAVRMHLPSRIEYHNATSRRVDRGNIVSWEQPLRDRLRGQPLEMDARMHTQSILYRTLTIFSLALAAALVLMALIVVWVRRKGSPPATPAAKQA